MKKKIVTYAVLVTLALSISACGGATAGNNVTQSDSKREETSSADNSSNLETEEEKFESVEELLSNPEAVAELESTMSELADESMEVEIYGNGAQLVYSLKILDMGGADSEAMADAMKEAFSSMSDYWVELAGSLREVVDVPTPVVVIEVLDPNGQTLMKEEYPAE